MARRLNVSNAISRLGREKLQTELDKDTSYLLSIGVKGQDDWTINYLERFVTPLEPFEYLIFNNKDFVIWLLKNDRIDFLAKNLSDTIRYAEKYHEYEDLIPWRDEEEDINDEEGINDEGQLDAEGKEDIGEIVLGLLKDKDKPVPYSWCETIWKKFQKMSKDQWRALYQRYHRIYVYNGKFEKLLAEGADYNG